MPEAADRDANRALRERLADVYRRYERLRSELDELPGRLATLQVTTVSEDGRVRATVGPRGQLLDLHLRRSVSGAAPRVVDDDELARIIVATAREAADRMADEVEALMADYLPPGSGVRQFLRDNDFGSLMRRPDAIMRPPSRGRPDSRTRPDA